MGAMSKKSWGRAGSNARIIASMVPLGLLFGCVTYLIIADKVSVTGTVQNIESGAPIAGVEIEIGRAKVLNPKDFVRIAVIL